MRPGSSKEGVRRRKRGRLEDISTVAREDDEGAYGQGGEVGEQGSI